MAALMVLVDPADGKALWRAPGGPFAFASFIVADIAGQRQVIGYDRDGLGGWSVADGQRFWSLKPRHSGDFNVSTPVLLSRECLLIVSRGGKLVLVDATGDGYRPLGRTRVFTEERGLYSHPAMVGRRLYIRGSERIVCLEFEDDQ